MNENEKIQLLKELLASIVVFTYKVQNLHWNIKWRGFLYIHPKLWDLYDAVFDQQDKLAERIRQLKWNPSTSLEESLSLSWIEETKEFFSSEWGLYEALKWLIFLESASKALAERLGSDLATQQLVLDFQMFYSQEIFLISSELEDNNL